MLNCSRLLGIIKQKAREKAGDARMSSKDESGKIEYHYGFYGAIHAEYEPKHVQLEYLQEHELGEEPVRMDMLIIKRDSASLTDPIGSFFRTHNALEYKSPEDALTIDDFFKAQGYAEIYKSMGKTVNEIPRKELTVSIFRHAYPREMFHALTEEGLQAKAVYPGVYRVMDTNIAAQIIVTSRLPEGEYSPFKALAKNASKEDLLRLLKLADSDDPRMVDYVRAVLNVSIVLNEQTMDKIKEEAGIMPEAVRRVFKEEFEAAEEKAAAAAAAKAREEQAQEFYDRLIADNIPKEKARALAFG